MARKKLVAGNWKMYTAPDSARRLAAAVVAGIGKDSPISVVVCPPFPFLSLVEETIKGSPVALGAQNCYHEREGAFTGEVSPVMLADVGCTHVILGHSERRHKLGETDDFINRKVRLALEVGLRVILCVGETLDERTGGQTEQVVLRQLTGGLQSVPENSRPNVLLAYEPVWAIGTGQNATPEQAQEVHSSLRGKVAAAWGKGAADGMTILYGGSVKPDNAAALMTRPDVDGGLVGGASLKADEFLAIVEAAASK